MKKVWHKKKHKPREDEDLLIEDELGTIHFAVIVGDKICVGLGRVTVEDWDYSGVRRWAYVKDIEGLK